MTAQIIEEITPEILGNRYIAIGALLTDKREQCTGHLFYEGYDAATGTTKEQACAVGVIFSAFTGVKTREGFHRWQRDNPFDTAYKLVSRKLGIPAWSWARNQFDVDQIWKLNDRATYDDLTGDILGEAPMPFAAIAEVLKAQFNL